MKRLNKKGFTLVELLAAIVILAVLMLVGAQAVGTILNNSNANSLVNSLDMAVKQGTMKFAEGNLASCPSADPGQLKDSHVTANKADTLKDVLTYEESQYKIYACSSGDILIVQIQPTTGATGGKFKNSKCTHGNILKMPQRYNVGADGTKTPIDKNKNNNYDCVKQSGSETINYIERRVNLAS